MVALPNPPLISVEEYLATHYPDGDREFVDGVVLERNVGTPGHSALQKILIVHLAAYEKKLGLAVRPECRTRIEEARYRVPDVAVMKRPFRQSDKVLLDPPLIIIEIVSPEDRVRDTMRRFREYSKLGVKHIIQMDPEDRTTHLYVDGDLVHARELKELDSPAGPVPFDSEALLALLDHELGDLES